MLRELQPTTLAAGDAQVPVRQWQHDPPALLFVNLHQNESTSVEAAQLLLRELPGRLVVFAAGNTRTLEGQVNGRPFRFDPNRVFSPAGIAATLRKHNPHAVLGAAEAVAAFAREYVACLALREHGRVVAIHNTGDDYNIHAYEHGGEEAAGAAAVHVSPQQHHHDFYFVTEPAVYATLSQRGYNTVLQAPSPPDDGSLSVYCAQQGIPYINVEGRYHQAEHQARMLRELYTLPPP